MTYEEIINLALRRSIFFPANEIYNGPAGLFDYGPIGTAIKRKIVELWRKFLVKGEEMFELDGAALMPEEVFLGSGHLEHFNDPMVQCKNCKVLHRADVLLQEINGKEWKEATPLEEINAALKQANVQCPRCQGELTEAKRFNMLVPAELGIVAKKLCFLRPETCQTLFLDFSRILKTCRVKLPIGLAQVGKSFRNEISPRQSLMRQVEFWQMEIEIFFDPDKINEHERFEEVADYELRIQRFGSDKIETIAASELANKGIVSGKFIAYFLARVQQLYEAYGIPIEKMRFRELGSDERAFYAKEGWDFEVLTSLGWLELIANNYRTDYDLTGHSKVSKADLSYIDETGKKFIPHIFEISIGLDRTFYAILETALRKDKRVFLALERNLAPFHIGVFPLLSNRIELVNKAKEIYKNLKANWDAFYDDSGSIGRRYARADEIGVPLALTVDFETLSDGTVTLRDRDTTNQIRVKIEKLDSILKKYFYNKTDFDKLI